MPLSRKWAIRWTEFERGWGQRDEGFGDPHDTRESAEKSLDRYYKSQPTGYVPDCYARGEIQEVLVDETGKIVGKPV